MKVWIVTDEEYPSYSVSTKRAPGAEINIDQETHERWEEVERLHQEMRAEIKNLVDPPCPECGHPKSRHQEWSKGWNRWGCLVRTCRCQHGKPEGR